MQLRLGTASSPPSTPPAPTLLPTLTTHAAAPTHALVDAYGAEKKTNFGTTQTRRSNARSLGQFHGLVPHTHVHSALSTPRYPALPWSPRPSFPFFLLIRNTKIPRSTMVHSLSHFPVPFLMSCFHDRCGTLVRASFPSKIPTYVVPTLYPLKNHPHSHHPPQIIYTSRLPFRFTQATTPASQHPRLYSPPYRFCFQLLVTVYAYRLVGYVRHTRCCMPPLFVSLPTLHADSIFKNHGLAHHIWTFDMVMIN